LQDIDELTDSMKRDGLRFAAVVRVKSDGSWSGALGGRVGVAAVDNVVREVGVKPGDLFVVAAGKYDKAHLAAGRFRTEVAGRLASRGFKPDGTLVSSPGGHVQRRAMNFLWVEEFPLFLPKEGSSEEGQELESAHHPFTAPQPEDEELVRSDPRRARSQHYDLGTILVLSYRDIVYLEL